MDRLKDLRADYVLLGRKLADATGTASAAIVRERRLISAELERMSKPEGARVVDQLAKRRAKSGVSRPPVRRSGSG